MSAAETVKGWSQPALFAALVGAFVLREVRPESAPQAGDIPNERVAVLETRMEQLAKREDISALGGKLDAYTKGVDGVERRTASLELWKESVREQLSDLIAAIKSLVDRVDKLEKSKPTALDGGGP